jgi:hypothetical protein
MYLHFPPGPASQVAVVEPVHGTRTAQAKPAPPVHKQFFPWQAMYTVQYCTHCTTVIKSVLYAIGSTYIFFCYKYVP